MRFEEITYDDQLKAKLKHFSMKFKELEFMLEDQLINQTPYKTHALRSLEETYYWATRAFADEQSERI